MFLRIIIVFKIVVIHFRERRETAHEWGGEDGQGERT